MGMVSDPSVRAAERPAWSGFEANEAPLPTAPSSPVAIAAARRRHRWWINGTLALVSTLVALRLLASALVIPLENVGTVPAAAWQVEVTTNSARSGIALAYGHEVGFQLLSIPAGENSTSSARVIPARLAQGEVHLISLSRNSLNVQAPGAPGSGVVQLSATSAIVSLFQTPKATGIRTGW